MERPGAEWFALRRAECVSPPPSEGPHMPDDRVPSPELQLLSGIRPSKDPVLFAEALERLLPHCNGNPFDVADWLNNRHRTGRIRLFGVLKESGTGSAPVMMAPNANPVMLRVMARVPPDGGTELYVAGLGIAYQDWTFERASFEVNFPGAPVNRGGRPRVYDRENVLVEAAMAIFEDGLPEPLSLESLCNMVAARLSGGSPELTLLKKVLKPLYERLQRYVDSR
jgi:hypothetical protein